MGKPEESKTSQSISNNNVLKIIEKCGLSLDLEMRLELRKRVCFIATYEYVEGIEGGD